MSDCVFVNNNQAELSPDWLAEHIGNLETNLAIALQNIESLNEGLINLNDDVATEGDIEFLRNMISKHWRSQNRILFHIIGFLIKYMKDNGKFSEVEEWKIVQIVEEFDYEEGGT